MNKKYQFVALFYLLFLIQSCSISALGSIQNLFKIDSPEDLITTFEGKIEKQLKILKQNKEEIASSDIYKENLEQVEENINSLKNKLKEASKEQENFLKEKLSFISQRYQVLSELEQVSQQIVDTITDHMKILCEYGKDPLFTSKNLKLPTKALYSFEEAQKLYNLIVDYENEIKDLEEKQKKISVELANRNRALSLAEQEHTEKKRQQQQFLEKVNGEKEKFTSEQQAELIDLQEELADHKEELAKLKVVELEQRSNFIESQIKTKRIQLDILKEEYERIKRLVRVDDTQLQKTQNTLEQKRQEIAREQGNLKDKIGAVLFAQNALEDNLNEYITENDISSVLLQSYEAWEGAPETIEDWKHLVSVGQLNNKLALNNESKDLLEAQSQLLKGELKEEEVNSLITGTWNKFTTHKNELDTQAELNKELQKYESLKVEVQADLSSISDKKSTVAGLFNNNAKILENIKEHLNNLEKLKNTLFKDNIEQYTQILSQLKNAEEELRDRGDIISKLHEVYISTHELLSTVLKSIEGMLVELKGKVQWIGVARPIWKGLKDFIPDINRFINDLQTVFAGEGEFLTLNNLQNWLSIYTENVYPLLALFLKIAIAVILFALVKLYLPDLSNFIQEVGAQYGFGNKIISFIAALLNFIKIHLFGLFIWICLLISVRQGFVNPYIGILFYLFSIPYMLFYAYKFISYIAQINKENNYIYISEDFQRRFFSVISFLIYFTIVILLFRQAFLLGNYEKSDVPTVLLAFNFLILQISIVLLISKEHVLELIPKTSELWKSIYELVEEYYYLFLILALIIIFVSNPYIGFGPHFFSIIIRFALIILLIPLFSALHNYVKRASIAIFFKTKGDVVKERFSSGKTLYGLFIIGSFLMFIALGIIIGTNILGYKVGLTKIYEWLNTELFESGAFTAKGKPIPVTSLSLLNVVLFILSGFIVAYLVNRFILRRMFELLLVNVGIQTALMSLTRYVIITIFLIIGLQAAGLSSTSMFLYLLAIIGGVGFAAKDFITDVLSYFVILVQRPLKIGDLIQVNESIIGIVRHITLRSIIIRKKNSVTIIIPNSYIVTRPITNWSYAPTFIAFNDIILEVPYSVNPDFVKELIFKALNKNLNVLKSPAPIVWLSSFTPSGFEFTIRGYLSPDKVLEIWEINSQVRFELVKIFRSNNIAFACPTRVIMVNDKSKNKENQESFSGMSSIKDTN